MAPKKTKAPLSKSALLALDDRPILPFLVETWGEYVNLRTPSLRQLLEIGELERVDQSKELLRVGLVDADGDPMLNANGEIGQLWDKNPKAMSEIVQELRRRTGDTDAAVAEEEGN